MKSEKVEFPEGSNVFPFSCPTFVGREFPELSFELDAAQYGYHGGSTPEWRKKWISSADTSEYRAAFLERYASNATSTPGVGFCTCNPPWTGAPPNCVYACGKARYSIAGLNVSGSMAGESQCETCLNGAECDEMVNGVQTIKLKGGYWRTNWRSREIKKCPRSALCKGGPSAGSYCVKNHHGPYCMICDEGFFQAGGKCMSCDGASAHSPSSLALIVASVLVCVVVGAHKMSTRFRAFEARIQWREIVTVKGKIIGALPAR